MTALEGSKLGERAVDIHCDVRLCYWLVNNTGLCKGRGWLPTSDPRILVGHVCGSRKLQVEGMEGVQGFYAVSCTVSNMLREPES